MKWYMLNAAPRLRYAIQHPRYALKTAFRELTFADERFLAAATGTRAGQIRGFLQEPSEAHEFMAHLRGCEEVFKTGFSSADVWAKKVLLQYAAVRALQPDIVVETGVASGVSSSYLLLAMQRNQKGKLYSVEIGDKSYLPPGMENGWIVPDGLRSRWTMHIGDSAAILPALLAGLGQVDIFIHDSLHTYDQMKFEFNLARPHIRPGGLLLADDALWNDAFKEFAHAVNSPAAEIIRGVGFLRT
jgi:predicted O-methyltransferase YrrM